MHKLIFPDNLVLASQSPRRKYLLEQAGFKPRILEIDIDEDFPEHLHPEDIAEYLALKKGNACVHKISATEICITADTVVILDEKILGKPTTKHEAREMLYALAGRQHLVITGVCVIKNTIQESFSVSSKVHFSELLDGEIDYYIEHYKPFDKAGAYGIQEWLGWCKITKIEGSYSNIMGLPLHELYEHLMYFDRL